MVIGKYGLKDKDKGEKERMLRYKVLGNSVISIDLNNGYSVISVPLWDRENKNYLITLYLKGDGYDTLDLIETKENIIINADMKTIKLEVTKMITNLLTEGFFKRYIDRYQYMMKCFAKGNEFFEEKGEYI